MMLPPFAAPRYRPSLGPSTLERSHFSLSWETRYRGSRPPEDDQNSIGAAGPRRGRGQDPDRRCGDLRRLLQVGLDRLRALLGELRFAVGLELQPVGLLAAAQLIDQPVERAARRLAERGVARRERQLGDHFRLLSDCRGETRDVDTLDA